MTFTTYINALKQKRIIYAYKIELLGYYENVIGEITQKKIDGQLNVNYQQGIRRSVSLTIADVDKEFLPSENSGFWYKRKFKLYIGVKVDDDVMWFPQGVFVTKGANADSQNRNLSIEGVDKWKEIEDFKLDVNYVIPSGTNITKLIKDTLALHTGGAYMLDCIEPIVDLRLKNQTTQSKIEISAGSSMSELLIDIANGYGLEIFYDVHGTLNVCNAVETNRYSGYKMLGHQWEYDSLISPDMDYSLDAENTVTVYTNASKTALVNVSYTAENNNPKSPISVAAIGTRRMESQEITYINVSAEEMTKKCEQYAKMLLNKVALQKCSISFQSPIIPHMDVDGTIGITDEYYGLDNETYVVQSLTMPLNAGLMTVQACNITFLAEE